jgi:hypothetical protein
MLLIAVPPLTDQVMESKNAGSWSATPAHRSSHSSFHASSHFADDNTEVGTGDISDDDDRTSVISDASAPSTNLTFLR